MKGMAQTRQGAVHEPTEQARVQRNEAVRGR